MELVKLMPKFIWKNTQEQLEKEISFPKKESYKGRLTLGDIKTYCKALQLKQCGNDKGICK